MNYTPNETTTINCNCNNKFYNTVNNVRTKQCWTHFPPGTGILNLRGFQVMPTQKLKGPRFSPKPLPLTSVVLNDGAQRPTFER